MTKFMILKFFIGLLILSGFSCAKKSERKVTPHAPILENLTSAEKTKLDMSKKESSNRSSPSSIDFTKAKDTLLVPITKTTTETKTIIISQDASADHTKKQGAEVQSKDETKAQVKDQEPQVSDEEKSAILKIKAVNQKKIDEILNQPKKVVFNAKVIDVDQAMKELKKGNEDSFCTLAGNNIFQDQKMIAVTGVEKKLIDKQSDVFETEIALISQNHKATLKCTHTTDNFYIEQFAVNMSQYFEVWSDTKKMETANFKNPRTLNRTLNAVKIINFKLLQAASATEDRKALVNGKLVSEEQSLELIKSGKERTACVVSEISKNLDPSKAYIRVDRLMGPDKYSDVIEQHTIYRADKDNYFIFQCMMTKKTSEWYDLIQVAQGVLKFGVLNRIEYNKIYDEVKAINEKMKNEN